MPKDMLVAWVVSEGRRGWRRQRYDEFGPLLLPWGLHAERHVVGRELVSKGRDANDAGGMFYLGLCYYDGDCMPKEMPAAGGWYQKAASAGYAGAMTNLGYCYNQGDCMPKDFRPPGAGIKRPRRLATRSECAI